MTSRREGEQRLSPWPVGRHGLVEIRPRSRTGIIARNRTCLVGSDEGFITPDRGGLYVHQTRILSRYRYLLDGEPPHAVVLATPTAHAWMGYYVAPAHRAGTRAPIGTVPQQVIELHASRAVGDGLMDELVLVNYTTEEAQLTLALEVDADFADLIDTGSNQREPGERTRRLRHAEGGAVELTFAYHGRNEYDHQGERGVAETRRSSCLRVARADSPPRVIDDADPPRIEFDVRLAPRARWRARIEVRAEVDGTELGPPRLRHPIAGPPDDFDLATRLTLRDATHFDIPSAPPDTAQAFLAALRRAAQDLADLRLFDVARGEHAWVAAGGLPIYQAFFGRDAMTAGAQGAMLTADMLRGTLPELARWQGTEVNDWREEQPGRMLHQMRTGPTAVLNRKPWARHYATITTSAFFPSALSELWRWTADRAAVEPLLEPALRALRWLDEYADLDGDGFYEYRTRSEAPLKNQGWKDSGEAIVYPDGTQVPDPIAVCDAQGFAYMSQIRMAELLWWLGDRSKAAGLFKRAQEFKRRFNERFWLPDQGFFALGLDPDKRPIATVASNAGHLLAAGIIDQALVEPTVQRLFARDMFSGWGIRSLSTENPAYNPYAYQRGSIWPVEHGTFALGFARYGLSGYAAAVVRAQAEAAALFNHERLPEVFSGHARDPEHPFPALYTETNWPQAWSASALVAMAQALVGIYPFAPLNLLLVDPHLPEWLPELSLDGLHVGRAVVSLRFFRQPDGRTGYEVTDQRGELRVVRQPSPWSLVADLPERVEDLMRSLL
jgi:glycogen debranching enzyme